MLMRTAISAIMTRAPTTVAPSDTLLRVQQAMLRHRIHHIPVVAEGKLVGLVSANDVRRVGPPEGTPRGEIEAVLEAIFVGQVMERDVVTIAPSDELERATDLLGVGSFYSLPVVNADGELVGIVTTADLIAFLSQHREPHPGA